MLGKVLSPSKERNTFVPTPVSNDAAVPKEKPILMTRRELTDPFGSDDDEDENPNYSTLQDESKNNCSKDVVESATPTIDPVTANVSFAKS